MKGYERKKFFIVNPDNHSKSFVQTITKKPGANRSRRNIYKKNGLLSLISQTSSRQKQFAKRITYLLFALPVNYYCIVNPSKNLVVKLPLRKSSLRISCW